MMDFEILKDFVRYEHAFIILDGLDEVPTIELHNRIVDLVRIFIQSYCMQVLSEDAGIVAA